MNNGASWTAMGVATVVMWSAVALLIAGVWIALWVGHDPLAQAFGFTGCALSAGAAVLHIRRYTCRVLSVIRALHTPAELEKARELTPVR